jgi:Co/Zn/Cd efflux system component
LAAAFFFNCDVGRAESPVSPRADALDFLGDAAKYAVALAVVGLSLKWRAVAAPLKGGVMGLFGLWVAGSTIYNAVVGIVPKGELMGTVGLLALAANLCVAGLLYPYRQGDSRPYRSGCAREPTGEMVEAILSLGSQETRRWREMDSNFQYASTVRRHRATDLPLPPIVKRGFAGRPPPMARLRSEAQRGS